MVGGRVMRLKSALAAFLLPFVLMLGACGTAQDGCYDDGERVSCGDDDWDDDDREYDDDDDWGDDD